MLVIMKVAFVVVLAFLLLISRGQAQGPCGSDVTISPSQIVRQGENVTFTCQQPNSVSIVFVWNFLAANLSTTDAARSLQRSSGPKYYHDVQPNISMHTLLITNVMHSDLGWYSCERINPPTCVTGRSELTLFEQATVTVASKENRIYTGQTLNLTTVVAGNPLPTTITVEKWNEEARDYLDYPSTRYSITGLSTILFSRVSLEDSGQYRVCVENTHDAIDCDTFSVAVTGLKIFPSVATIKRGDSLLLTCRVINHFGDSEMTWQRATTTDNLANDPSVRVTQLNTTDLQLSVERITEPVGYSCVVRNNMGAIVIENVRVEIMDVPGPPRNLDVSANSDGGIFITWIAPETDNGSPLTAYYVNVTVGETNSTVTRVVPGKRDLEYLAGQCKVINVTVTSENACGNSSAMEFSIDTRNQCDLLASPVGADSEADDESNPWPIIGAGIAVVVIFVSLTLLVILVFIICLSKQRRDSKHSSALHDPESPSHVEVKSQKTPVTSSPPPFIKRTTSIRRYRNLLEVSRDSVTLRDYLQDGTYFELRKAHIILQENGSKAHEVMVKKAKQSAPSEEEHNIQEEIKMMSMVGSHENVVSLLRTCLSESPAYLITEYFSHGDLLGFLRASRGHYGMYTVSPGTGYKTRPCAVQGQDLLKMVTQVASGMSYLAEKNVTHRSLCARNVLVGTGLQVKVYNYGPKADAEATPLNYEKWMAPEMLFDGTANTMSDIWSFGVTFWEIVTIGGSPYPNTHPEQMTELLQSGHRLPKPVHCDEALYNIMQQCWNHEPNKRPSFTTLHNELDTMCKSKLSYLDSSLYDGDEYSQFEETNQLMTAL